MSRLLSRCAAVVSSLTVIILLAGIAVAQEYRGRVQGIVSDPSQAAVAGATVTLRNVNTGVEVVRQTDAAGHYLFDFVLPGTYSVTVVAPGFQKFVQENAVVQTTGDVTVNASLAVGAVTETVSVLVAVVPQWPPSVSNVAVPVALPALSVSVAVSSVSSYSVLAELRTLCEALAAAFRAAILACETAAIAAE